METITYEEAVRLEETNQAQGQIEWERLIALSEEERKSEFLDFAQYLGRLEGARRLAHWTFRTNGKGIYKVI